MFTGPNPIHPDQLSTRERLAEVAELLALGILRRRAETLAAEKAEREESSLHFMPAESGGHRTGAGVETKR